MAFYVKLYVLDCGPEVVDKTNYLTNENEITGVLLQDVVDVSTPFVELDHAVSISPGSGKASFWTANYCYIAQLHRYFFITGKEIVDNDHFVVRLEVDVLMTYRTTIKGTTFFVDRNENAGSWYIPDGNIPMSATVERTRLTTSVHPFNPGSGSMSISAHKYVICVAGGGATSSGLNEPSDFTHIYPAETSRRYYAMTLNQLQIFSAYLNSSAALGNWIAGDPKSGVFSVHALPFNIGVTRSGSLDVWIGKTNTNCKAAEIHNMYETDTTQMSTPLAVPGDFRISTGEVEIRIFLPMVGWQTLDVAKVADRPYLSVKYKTNVYTGNGVCTLYLTKTAGETLIDTDIYLTFEYNCAVQYPLTLDSSAEKQRSMMSSALTSVIAIGGAVASKNPALIASAVSGGAAAMAGQMMTPFSYHSVGAVSGADTCDLLPLYAHIVYYMRKSPVLDDSTQKARYAHRYGLMYQQSVALSSLTGRTVVTKFEMEMPSGCTTYEFDLIRQRLAEGVIL